MDTHAPSHSSVNTGKAGLQSVSGIALLALMAFPLVEFSQGCDTTLGEAGNIPVSGYGMLAGQQPLSGPDLAMLLPIGAALALVLLYPVRGAAGAGWRLLTAAFGFMGLVVGVSAPPNWSLAWTPVGNAVLMVFAALGCLELAWLVGIGISRLRRARLSRRPADLSPVGARGGVSP
jgi:hypothetical protein